MDYDNWQSYFCSILKSYMKGELNMSDEIKQFTVKELIEELKELPQDCRVYAEGEPACKVIEEKCPDGHSIVRIFKPWDVEFVLGSAGLEE